jgi:hypothetical protein
MTERAPSWDSSGAMMVRGQRQCGVKDRPGGSIARHFGFAVNISGGENEVTPIESIQHALHEIGKDDVPATVIVGALRQSGYDIVKQPSSPKIGDPLMREADEKRDTRIFHARMEAFYRNWAPADEESAFAADFHDIVRQVWKDAQEPLLNAITNSAMAHPWPAPILKTNTTVASGLLDSIRMLVTDELEQRTFHQGWGLREWLENIRAITMSRMDVSP